jgi:hypothetical protein
MSAFNGCVICLQQVCIIHSALLGRSELDISVDANSYKVMFVVMYFV